MRILNGWKEIAQCLKLTSRTAQRWERLGLPVRRVSGSSRSPIVAFSEEIEGWVQKRERRPNGFHSLDANLINYQETRRKTRKLVKQLEEAGTELKQRVKAIKGQLALHQASPAKHPWQIPDRR